MKYEPFVSTRTVEGAHCGLLLLLRTSRCLPAETRLGILQLSYSPEDSRLVGKR